MFIVDKKMFYTGLLMAVTFFVVLAVMFSPLFGGENAFQASDRLFNSIAKGSSSYFEDLREAAGPFRQTEIEVTIAPAGAETGRQVASLLTASGLQVAESSGKLQVSGRLADAVDGALADSESLFYNRGEEITAKRGFSHLEVLYAWWSALKEIQKALRNQSRFPEAAFLEEVTMKGVEVSYNFYGIVPERASSRAGILTFALLFYILYTLWWGYAILHLFNGMGMQMKATAKKEM